MEKEKKQDENEIFLNEWKLKKEYGFINCLAFK